VPHPGSYQKGGERRNRPKAECIIPCPNLAGLTLTLRPPYDWLSDQQFPFWEKTPSCSRDFNRAGRFTQGAVGAIWKSRLQNGNC
jgi:hypothetical protein